jgi:hypothetical protein
MTTATFSYYKMNRNIRVLFHDLGYSYWIDENTNYPEGLGNCYLCHSIDTPSRWECVGGVDGREPIFDDGEIVGYKKWRADLHHEWNEEVGTDSEVIYEGESRDEALKALWENRFKYSF